MTSRPLTVIFFLHFFPDLQANSKVEGTRGAGYQRSEMQLSFGKNFAFDDPILVGDSPDGKAVKKFVDNVAAVLNSK